MAVILSPVSIFSAQITVYTAVVAFSSLERIQGECLTIHSLPALFSPVFSK